MPTNRNALIRYKTINDCLSTGRKFDINDLIETCSEALRNFCGFDGLISERQIRDDIRVMRSDEGIRINAPIKVKNGKYYYSDSNFELLNILISDESLLEIIYTVLTDDNTLILHPDFDFVLEKLQKIKDWRTKNRFRSDGEIPGLMTFMVRKEPAPAYPTWGEIFRLFADKS